MTGNKKYTKYFFVICLYVIFGFVQCKIEYTPQERQILEQYRPVVADLLELDEYYKSDEFLMRWLRARNMDINATNRMAREAVRWRMENNIDNIVNENIYNFTTPPYVYQGFDREGRPIVLFTPTSIDLRKLILSGKRDVAIRCFDQMLERGFHELKNLTTIMSNGERVDQVTAILDMGGFNIRQHFCVQCLSIYVEWFLHLENYYPGALSHMVCINVNRLALPAIQFTRPFVSDSTWKALKVFGPDRQEWSKYLHTIISPDQLPYRFGGTSKNAV